MINEQGQNVQNVSDIMRVGHTAIRRWLQQYSTKLPAKDRKTAEQQAASSKQQAAKDTPTNWRTNNFGRMSPY